MRLNRRHSRSLIYSLQVLNQIALNSKPGPALDELREHIKTIKEAELEIRKIVDQGLLDYKLEKPLNRLTKLIHDEKNRK